MWFSSLFPHGEYQVLYCSCHLFAYDVSNALSRRDTLVRYDWLLISHEVGVFVHVGSKSHRGRGLYETEC